MEIFQNASTIVVAFIKIFYFLEDILNRIRRSRDEKRKCMLDEMHTTIELCGFHVYHHKIKNKRVLLIYKSYGIGSTADQRRDFIETKLHEISKIHGKKVKINWDFGEYCKIE